MRSMRLVGTMLALVLIASACGGDDESSDPEDPTPTSSSTPTTTQSTTQDTVTPTSAPDTVLEVVVPEPSDTEVNIEPDPVAIATPGTEGLPAPTNLKCLAGTREGELLVEWDAVSNPANISKYRLYVSEDGGGFITNGHFRIDEVDTTRASGTRWAAPVRRLPANVPLRFRVTVFNLLEQESFAHFVHGVYSGPGQPCGTDAPVIPPATCTAGCDEEEGEPAA